MVNRNRVVIIGGGAAGLASLRVFTEFTEAWDVTLYESRNGIGGIWYVCFLPLRCPPADVPL